MRVRHPDYARSDVHIGPAEPEKLARAYARPGRHAEHNDPLDMRGRRVVQQARLLDGRRRDTLGFGLGDTQRYQRVGKQQTRPYRPSVRRPQDAHAAVHGGLPHPALALHFAPGQHIVASDAVRPAVAENGRQWFDMLRRRAPCGGVFQCPRIPLPGEPARPWPLSPMPRTCAASPGASAPARGYASRPVRIRTAAPRLQSKSLMRWLKPLHGSRYLRTHCRRRYSTKRNPIAILLYCLRECIQYRRKAGLQRRELDPERFGLGLMRPPLLKGILVADGQARKGAGSQVLCVMRRKPPLDLRLRFLRQLLGRLFRLRQKRLRRERAKLLRIPGPGTPRVSPGSQ